MIHLCIHYLSIDPLISNSHGPSMYTLSIVSRLFPGPIKWRNGPDPGADTMVAAPVPPPPRALREGPGGGRLFG